MRFESGTAVALALLASSIQLVTGFHHAAGDVAKCPHKGGKQYYKRRSDAQGRPLRRRAPIAPNRLEKRQGEPILDPNDPRFQDFQTPQDGDSRSACPGLNTLANHGFLPRDGRQVNAADIVLACYHGFGMSPESCSIITLSGLEKSGNEFDFVFDLQEVDLNSWAIAHDCSLSRRDEAEGDSLNFDQRNWDVVLSVFETCKNGDRIDARCFGLARAARINDQRNINPNTNYDSLAAGHGAVEVSRTMLIFGNREEGAPVDYIKSLFEQERLPSNIGWQPTRFSAGVLDVLDVAEESQSADPQTLAAADDGGTVENRLDILTTLKSDRQDFLREVKRLVMSTGFREQQVYDNMAELDREMRERFGPEFEALIDNDPNNL